MSFKRILSLCLFFMCFASQIFAANTLEKWEKVCGTNIGTIFLNTANIEVVDKETYDKTIVLVAKETFHNPYFVAAIRKKLNYDTFEYILSYYMINVPKNLYMIKYVDYMDSKNNVIFASTKSLHPEAYVNQWYPIDGSEIVQKLYKKATK